MHKACFFILLVACASDGDGSKATCDSTATDLVDGADQNCDGLDGTDGDGDGAASLASGGLDCDDANPEVYPDAVERCDTVDNDCDGLVDEEDTVGAAGETYIDADGDGYYDPSPSDCAGDTAEMFLGEDCDDADPEIFPGAVESCDDWGRDEDCDGLSGSADPDEQCPFPSDATLKRDADAILWGENAGDLAGHIVRPAGDVDGDGNPDILVGAYNWQPEGEREDWCEYDGSTYLIYGPVSGAHSLGEVVAADPDDDDIRGVALRGANCDSTGEFMNGLGDLNGDGYDDFALAVPLVDISLESVSVPRAGAVYIIYGGPRESLEAETTLAVVDADPTPAALAAALPAADLIYGTYEHEIFGATQQVAGDFDGDGARDLVVSAYVGGPADEGEIYLLSDATDIASPLASSALIWLTGAEAGSRLGAGVVALGGPDFNADGIEDLAISGGQEDVDGLENAGRVRLFLGGEGIGGRGLADADHTWSGDEANLHLEALCAPGDLDGDGYAELIYAPGWAADEAASRWSVRVVRGCGGSDCGSPAPTLEISPASVEDQPTVDARCGGDLDGDGLLELVLHDMRYETLGTDAGTAQVLWHEDIVASLETGGSIDLADLTVSTLAAEQGSAINAGFVGDLTGDGLDDIAFGNPSAGQDPDPSLSEHEGAVFLFQGAAR